MHPHAALEPDRDALDRLHHGGAGARLSRDARRRCKHAPAQRADLHDHVLAVNLGFLISGARDHRERVRRARARLAARRRRSQTRDFPTISGADARLRRARDRRSTCSPTSPTPRRPAGPARLSGDRARSCSRSQNAWLRAARAAASGAGRASRSGPASRSSGIAALAGLFAPLIAPFDPNDQNLLASFERPSWHHLLGTDNLGRDVFSRVALRRPGRPQFGVITTYVPLVIGMLAGRDRRLLRRLDRHASLMRLVDVVDRVPVPRARDRDRSRSSAPASPALYIGVARRRLGALRAADPRRDAGAEGAAVHPRRRRRSATRDGGSSCGTRCRT